jgi:hypothetical protein
MSTIDLDKLEAAAKAATPGPWEPIASDSVDGGVPLRDRGIKN